MNLSVLLRRGLLVLAATTCGVSQFANALPAFARQTGQSCATCHVGALGPQLTPFGQNFKLGGYTMGSAKDSLPLSGMVVITHEHTSTALPDDAGPHDGANNNTNLQEASLFLAGKMSEHVGSFAQITYSDIDRKLALDNVDVRYANHATLFGSPVNWGVSVNNNPTLQDLWNSTPAWRFPYTSSALAPAPGAATLINGGLEHQVLGTTLYGMWDNHFYTEFGGYRSLSPTFLRKTNVEDAAGKISGTAPYWRLAYTDTMGGQNFGVGLYGLRASLHPERSTGATNVYTDVGVDANWQYALSKDDLFTVNASYVREHQQLDFSVAEGAAAKNSLHLNEFNVNASYYFQNTYGLTFGYFNTNGNGDATLYSPQPLTGSRAGSPDSRGYIVQADWTPWGKTNSWGSPWANVRLGVQYVDYTRFNGGSKNYDGFGRSASDNNTLFLFAWWAF